MQTEPEPQERAQGPGGPPAGTRRARARGAWAWRRMRRIAGGAGLIARGLVDTAHPLLVQIVPIRRCNIDCAYCNEYVSIMDFWRDPQTGDEPQRVR